MIHSKSFDVVIIGGSYAGLSAALALGRSLRSVLIIDSGEPCNRFTPHSHNFLTQDGKAPHEIASVGRQQVEKYETVSFHQGVAAHVDQTPDGFAVKTPEGAIFGAGKIILATGIRDIMPDIKGFAACWGISIIHCPYCHGYEVRRERTGVLSNGDAAFHIAKLVSNLTDQLTIFTNGKASFTDEQATQLKKHNIPIIETEIEEIEHDEGHVQRVVFRDRREIQVKAIYATLPFEQHSGIPRELGCQLNEQGLIEVDLMQKTSVPGVYACGDNSGMRAVSVAVAAGTRAGAVANFEFIEEAF